VIMVELRGAQRRAPQGSASGRIGRAHGPVLRIPIGGITQGAAVITVAFMAEAPLVVRAIVVRTTGRIRRTGGRGVLGKELEDVAVGERLPYFETDLVQELRGQVRGLVLTDVLRVDRVRQLAYRRGPVDVEAGHLVAGLVFRRRIDADIVVTGQQIPEYVEIAFQLFAAELRGARQPQLYLPGGHDHDSPCHEKRCVDIEARVFHLADAKAHAPGAEPAQPF